jgi:hypothetical protein
LDLLPHLLLNILSLLEVALAVAVGMKVRYSSQNLVPIVIDAALAAAAVPVV